MKNLRPFQIGLLAVFALVGVISVGILATFSGGGSNADNPFGQRVVIWGTFDREVMDTAFQEISRANKDFKVVQYIQKDNRTFEEELVNAIAEGNSPDVVIIDHETLVTYRSKLLAIPYDTLPQRTFKDTYIDGAEIFTFSDGVYALPLAVDPLVMYWNRDILANAGYSQPPATWEQLTAMTQEVTLRDATRNILQGMVAFGEYRNVINAKAALLMLIMQSGSQLVTEAKEGYSVLLDRAPGEGERRPMNAAVQFFVEFSNANSPLYSWNRSFQDDRTAFIGEELAVYFGFGSEAATIRERNPNFNFDVAAVPQGAGVTVKRNYGRFYGMALLKAAPNPNGGYAAMQLIAAPDTANVIAEGTGLVPTIRSLIAAGSADPYRQLLFTAALVTRGWLDPDPVATNTAFQEMIEDVVSNRQKVTTAVSDTVRRVELAF